MKPIIQYRIKETPVQVIHDNGEVVVKNGVLMEGEQLCAIYDLDEESFPFVCTLNHDLDHTLSTQGLSMQVGNWEGSIGNEECVVHEGKCDERMLYVCNECHGMHADETDICQICDCVSLRIVPESELIN
ncbi:hypothetical protein [Sporosarcina sp. SG10008]|uniref:hypothetical protein n=1 Tax=Sporosarcina sp. SG10008 TaxID=3373103 RepID=UPI0037DD2D6C